MTVKSLKSNGGAILMNKRILISLLILSGLLIFGTSAFCFLGYDMSGEFDNLMKNNPLDKDYEKEIQELSNSKDFNTQAWVEIESKYTKLWDSELNSIYKKLLAQLAPEEKALLIESQKGWLQYHLNEQKFVNQTFYFRKNDPIVGSQGRVQTITAYKERIRERTIELMEYYSMLGNEIIFEYKNKR
jgi:uncharacterized protein YecT (DUF1311 family)